MSVNVVAQCDVPGGSGEGGQGNLEESATRPLEDQGTSTTNSKRKRVKRSDAVEVKKERKKRRGKKQVGSNDSESKGLTCAVCCEALIQSGTKSNTSIQCPLCQYQACVKCVERYILDMREGQPQCMNPECQAEWHTSFLSKYFAKSWINGPYYKSRSEYYLKMEMAKLPEDHESLLNYRHCSQLVEDVKLFNTEVKELKRQLDEKKQIISFTNDMILEYRTSRYMVNLRDVEPEAISSRHGQLPCQDEQCKGFLHKETHVCNICDRITCKTCHILLGKESDEETVDHVCKKEDIETAKLLKVNTKPCPSCNMGVYKIEGCSQMFCTACKTAFGWNTGKVIKSNIHNPHYFEWRREQAEDGVIPRQPGDQPGEQVEENQREIYDRYSVPHLRKTDLWKRLGCLEPGMQLTLQAGLDTHGGDRAHIEDSLKNVWVDNMEAVLKFVKTLMAEIAEIEEQERPDAPRLWRLYYANNDTTESAFKNQLIKIDKRESKSKELKQVLAESARYIATQLSNVTESLESMYAAWDAVKKETSHLDRKLASIKNCFGGPIPEDGQFSHVLRATEFAKRLKREDAYPVLEEDALMEEDLTDLYYDRSRTSSHVAMSFTRNQGYLKTHALSRNDCDLHRSKDISIVWFRIGDLRIHDHEPLFAACDQRNATVIPMVLLPEDDGIESNPQSHRRIAINRAIIGLEKALKERVGGLPLSIVEKNEWHKALGTMIGKAEGKRVDFHFYMSAHKSLDPLGYTVQEEMVGLLKEKSHVRIHPYWGKTLFHPLDMSSHHTGRSSPSISTYSMDTQFPGSLDLIASCENMTQFRERCQGTLPVREPLEVPLVSQEMHDEELRTFMKEHSISSTNLDTTSCQIREDIPIEEEVALEHLESMLDNNEYMGSYRTSRMSASTSERGAMLSTALSLGTLSPRMVYRKVHDRLLAKKEGQEVSWTWGPKVTSSSLGEEWLLVHLVIRDYFIYLAEHEGDRIFNFGNDREWSRDKDAFDLWSNGQTGFPFVDASMRELHATGFMSNRARQNVASFLTKELGIDWRWGEAYFQKTLIDHDSGVNAESWAYIAGVGPGRRDTKFMTVTQGEKYDPDGSHIARWIPELSHLEPALRHRPWLSDQPLAYPAPIRPYESQVGKPPK